VSKPIPTNPIFFATPDEFRAWLELHHETETELWVGYHKKRTGLPSMTWSDAVDQALCFGWIDGIRESLDETRYTNRFTPRRSGSTWSVVNIRKVERLTAEGLMRPAGIKAYEARKKSNSEIYSYEQARKDAVLDAKAEQQFRANEAAWAWFEKAPPSYRKAAAWWVISAKKEETKAKRLATLIEDSARGKTVPPLTRR
jgi:uncharacterized protein YdeI (YjbR/CyaY-like superfamily)